MLPSLAEVLALPAVQRGDPLVRTGQANLHRPVRWVHVSEVAWIASLLEGGELILTTGIALPRAERDLRRYVEELSAVGVCGIAVELGRRYRRLPAGLVDAAADCELPLVELRREAAFVAVTQEVHTLILDARMRELLASDERQAHRALLTLLAVSPELPADAADRAAALRVPLDGRVLTGLAVRTVTEPADPDVLRDLGSRAAEVLRAVRVPALVGVLDDRHVAVLLAQDREGRTESVVRRVTQHLHATAGQRAELVVGVGTPSRGVDGARATVREAVRVADSAAQLPPHRGWFRTSDVRLHGLVHALRESEHLRDFTRRELAALIAHDAANGSALVEFLDVFCRAGGNKTAAAAALFISRTALYDRIERVERVLGVDLGDPQVVLSLHFALLARDALDRPGAAVRAVGPGPTVVQAVAGK